jgi:hypothetical protein
MIAYVQANSYKSLPMECQQPCIQNPTNSTPRGLHIADSFMRKNSISTATDGSTLLHSVSLIAVDRDETEYSTIIVQTDDVLSTVTPIDRAHTKSVPRRSFHRATIHPGMPVNYQPVIGRIKSLEFTLALRQDVVWEVEPCDYAWWWW